MAYKDAIGDLITQAVNQKKPVALDAAPPTVALDGADTYQTQDFKLKTAAVINQWLETDDLEGSETSADRLLNMFVGIVDENIDGELDESEQAALDVVLDCAWDYLLAQGIDEGDISSLLNDWDAGVAENVREYLASTVGDGDGDEAINGFAFGSDQSAVFDAAYKKVMAVRNGKRVRINKRISGTVRLSAKQKMALRKAQRRSHSSVAMMHRAKSTRVRGQLGLKPSR